MSRSQQAFVVGHYASRAQHYVQSTDHSAGDDLDQIEAELQNLAHAHVLDLGCGGGHVSYRAAPHVAEVVACDITESMLAAVAEQADLRGLRNIRVRQAAAEQLPFAETIFDVVLCRFTAHHWQNLEAGLREARRVLKPEGRAIFIDVTAPSHRVLDTHLQTLELLRDPSHVRDYSVAEWAVSLSHTGFAPRALTARKLRMHFPAWIARTLTTAAFAATIRSVQQAAPEQVRTYYNIEEDGSFVLDTTTFVTAAV